MVDWDEIFELRVVAISLMLSVIMLAIIWNSPMGSPTIFIEKYGESRWMVNKILISIVAPIVTHLIVYKGANR